MNNSTDNPRVLTSIDDHGNATLTLNRPEVLNTINDDLHEELGAVEGQGEDMAPVPGGDVSVVAVVHGNGLLCMQ